VQDFRGRPPLRHARQLVLGGGAVEAAGGHDGDAEVTRDALDLRHHAAGLDREEQAHRLAALAVQAEADHLRREGPRQLRRARPAMRLAYDEFVVADVLERDVPGASRPVQHLAQVLAVAVGLGEAVGPDQPVEDLAAGQRQVVLVLAEDFAHLLEQGEALGLWLPGRVTPDSGAARCPRRR
jgi:hypothetical protein